MKSHTIFVAFIIATLISSCDKFLEVDPPKSRITSADVFSNDVTVTSAMMGVYGDLMAFATGHANAVSGMGGLAADEFININSSAPSLEVQRNTITSKNAHCENLWANTYRTIFEVNNILDKMAPATGITENTKRLLGGEALFIRAFTNFYLVNLFGPVPLVLTTNYEITALQPRTDTAIVYAKIEEDLITAISLLPDAYPGANRGRPNKAVAKTLLARVYLYLGKWEAAANMADDVIENGPYSLEEDPGNVFLLASKEAIWQLYPADGGVRTTEWEYLSYPNGEVVLHAHLADAFQSNDKRKIAWTITADTVTFSTKYKENTGLTLQEASVVFRLPELLLIRAEARARLNEIENALSDLNQVHERAGLDPLSNLDKDQLLEAIAAERRLEFFGEGAHRWLDLKRTGKAVSELTQSKGSFQSYMQLFPIPRIEFQKNPKLGDQNPGYQ